jgi:hypothetical protein
VIETFFFAFQSRALLCFLRWLAPFTDRNSNKLHEFTRLNRTDIPGESSIKAEALTVARTMGVHRSHTLADHLGRLRGILFS